MEHLFFTIEGAFGLFHPSLKVKGSAQKIEPAVALSRHTVFGDY